ncbi:N-acetylmuramoyl-L-alanine amidase [Henriciella mobilis]|uniref:N-acetylmuramoyl-L-alanine amidase n=1 Tax=Henriciella mobilis TaxID=2305467 RepID=A0A399R9H7_9PROT|nr:N-acetylmuramoyl-L-alanine amidase [Henriciella mobilis]
MVTALIRILLLWTIFCLSASAATAAVVSEIIVSGDNEYTRILFAADEPIEQETFLISDANGRRVDVRLPGATVSLGAHTPPPNGAIDAYEIRQGEVVFNLTTPMMVSRTLNMAPTRADPRHRLLIDLVRVAPIRFDRASMEDAVLRQQYLAAYTPDSYRKAQPLGSKPDQYTVVIDPGHGGKDPGALAATNQKEKTIVLQTSLAIKQVLERSGRYRVHLTRSDDTYVDHEDRVSMARSWGADLFISVHADAAGNPDVAGATVYTLSARGERRIDGTAKTNGWHLPIEDGTSQEVSGILEDLILRETKSNSTVFAELLTPELEKAGPIVRNSHRRANFFVLLAPDVPAVLLEIGFLTNRSDVARLSSESGRRKTAEAVGRAIDAYFDRRDVLYAAN